MTRAAPTAAPAAVATSASAAGSSHQASPSTWTMKLGPRTTGSHFARWKQQQHRHAFDAFDSCFLHRWFLYGIGATAAAAAVTSN